VTAARRPRVEGGCTDGGIRPSSAKIFLVEAEMLGGRILKVYGGLAFVFELVGSRIGGLTE